MASVAKLVGSTLVPAMRSLNSVLPSASRQSAMLAGRPGHQPERQALSLPHEDTGVLPTKYAWVTLVALSMKMLLSSVALRETLPQTAGKSAAAMPAVCRGGRNIKRSSVSEQKEGATPCTASKQKGGPQTCRQDENVHLTAAHPASHQSIVF